MNIKVLTVIFSSFKITSNGGQGPGNSGGSATTMAPNKSHIEEELHSICQIESFLVHPEIYPLHPSAFSNSCNWFLQRKCSILSLVLC
jgi:hypothetical protein